MIVPFFHNPIRSCIFGCRIFGSKGAKSLLRVEFSYLECSADFRTEGILQKNYTEKTGLQKNIFTRGLGLFGEKVIVKTVFGIFLDVFLMKFPSQLKLV